MSDTTIVQTNVPISFLLPCSISELSSESLFLVSVPNSETETGYISKNIKFEDIEDLLCSDFNIYKINNSINKLSTLLSDFNTEFDSNVIKCNIVNPYIISSITLKNGSIRSVSGYRLSAGMQLYFISGTKFDGQLRIGSIELYGDSTNKKPYIDFHYNSETSKDYTSRIIENSSGTLTIISNLNVAGDLTALNNIEIKKNLTLTGTTNIVNNSPISSNYSISTRAPSLKSVYDYCENTFLKTVGFANPEDALNTLKNILNTLTKCFYVDAINGSDDNKITGEQTNPFKTLQHAIDYINGIRFLGNSTCRIRILSDITVDLKSPISIYHPDLVQSKYLYIEGWTTADGGKRIDRTVTILNYLLTDSIERYAIRVWASVQFSNLVFVRNDYDANDPSKYLNGNRGNEAITNIIQSYANSNRINITACTFKGLYFGITATSANITACTFECCLYGIRSTSGRIDMSSSKFINCWKGGTATYSGTIYINNTGKEGLLIYNKLNSAISLFFSASSNGNITINLAYRYGYQFNNDDTWNTAYAKWYIEGLSNQGINKSISLTDIRKALLGISDNKNILRDDNGYYRFAYVSDTISTILLIDKLS